MTFFKNQTFELFVDIGFLTKNRPYGRFCKFCPSSLRFAAALKFFKPALDVRANKISWLREMEFARLSHKCDATARKFVVIRTSLSFVLIYKF